MTITTEDLLLLLPGQKVIVTACEAGEHGDNRGCLCKLKGTQQTVERLYETIFVGTPSWWLEGTGKTARLSELTLVRPEEAE